MLTVRALRWISVIVPTAFVVGFELVTRYLVQDVVPTWGHAVVALAAISLGAFAFSTFVFATMARLEREIRERNRRLALLNAVANEASQSVELEEVAEAIALHAKRALRADVVGLALASETDGELRLVAQSGLPARFAREDGSLGVYDCECRRALALNQPVITRDSRSTASCAGVLEKGEGTCISAPIRSKGSGIGVILLARPFSRPFRKDEIELITALGSQIGAVLQNVQLFSKTGAIAMLQERQRVAREVHDGLAQTLGYLNVQMGIVDRLLARDEARRAQAELEAMMRVTREAYEDVRQSIMDLRTTPASSGGLLRTLREYIEQFSLQTAVPCHFEGEQVSPPNLPPAAEVQLLRIVQEALANVKKHAPGAHVWVSVQANDRLLRLLVRDDGPGFNPDEVERVGMYGLRTMTERAGEIGGALTIESRPGAGTRLEIVVPAVAARVA